MPTVCRFKGIIIQLYTTDHEPIHIHVKYNGHKAKINLKGEVKKGSLPPKQLSLVRAWILLRKDEIKKEWNHARKEEKINKILP